MTRRPKTFRYSIAPAGLRSNGTRRLDFIVTTYAKGREPIHRTGFADEQRGLECLKELTSGFKIRLVRVQPGDPA